MMTIEEKKPLPALQLSRLDRAIAKVAPSWALGRLRSRLQTEIARQRLEYLSTYDAAEKTRNTADWPATNKSADQAILGDASTLQARARAAARDNWDIASMLSGFARHIVGTGIMPRADAHDALTGNLREDFNTAADKLFIRWATRKQYCDIERKKTFLAMQHLAIREYKGVGQSFAIISYKPRPDMVGLVIQMFESEQLAVHLTRDPNTQNEIRNGIELDDYGAAVAYHVYIKGHPLDSYNADPQRIEASRVIHLMRQDRPRQSQGVTALAPVLRESWHTKMYEEYTLLRARFEACGGASVETDLEASSAQLLGALTGTAGDSADSNLNKQMTFEPNMLWELPPGKKAVFHDPKTPGGQHDPYTKLQIAKIAAGGGLDYPTVSRDYSKNTFYGQRQGLMETWLETDPEQLHLQWIFCVPVYEAFVTAAVLEGRLKAPGFFEYDEQRAEYLEADWQPQPKYAIDEAKRAAAEKIETELKIRTREDLTNRRGKPFRRVIRKISEEEQFAASQNPPVTFPEAGGATPAIAPQEARPSSQIPEPSR